MARVDNDPSTIVAVDLGSNSFHMVIGRVRNRELQIVDRVREPVCLAAGLDKQGRLSDEARERARACLARMAQRLRGVVPDRVRAVGTNTLRRAANGAEVRKHCEAALGHPIEIVSGAEEARLIHLGVATSQFSRAPRLVADIGGGSTEIILGEGFEVLKAHSLFMGCVEYTRAYFPRGALEKECFRRAEIAARLELSAIEKEMLAMGWEGCIGSSGTIQAVHEILQLNGWSDGDIRPEGLKRLRKVMIEAGDVGSLSLPGLRADRAGVLPGGLAILRAIFKSLGIETMGVSTGALREGVLYDLLGRIRHEDVRDRTVAKLVERYHVDLDQATRVARTALGLARQVQIGAGSDAAEVQRLLTWAARLHEVGLALSHTGFHKHGAYLVANSDMAGFSADDQRLLAATIRGHRRRVSRSMFDGLPETRVDLAMRLCVLFRLAVLLNRGRVAQTVPVVRTAGDWSKVELEFPARWSAKHPLTVADLEQEAPWLTAIGVVLRWEFRSSKSALRSA